MLLRSKFVWVESWLAPSSLYLPLHVVPSTSHGVPIIDDIIGNRWTSRYCTCIGKLQVSKPPRRTAACRPRGTTPPKGCVAHQNECFMVNEKDINLRGLSSSLHELIMIVSYSAE